MVLPSAVKVVPPTRLRRAVGMRGSRFYLFVTQGDHEARARHLNISNLYRTLPCAEMD